MNKRKLIITLSSLLGAAIITLLTILVIIPQFKDKTIKETVSDAIRKTNKSYGPSNKILGMSKLNENAKKTTYDYYFSLTLSDTDIDTLSLLKGLSLSETHFISDPKTNNFIFSFGLNFADVIELFDASIFCTDEGYAITVPTIFDDYAYVNKADTLMLIKNAISSYAPQIDAENPGVLIPDVDIPEAASKLSKLEELEKLFKGLIDKLIYENNGETQYSITLNKTTLEEFMASLKPYISDIIGETEYLQFENDLIKILQDYKINLILNDKGYLNRMDIDEIKINNLSFSFTYLLDENEQKLILQANMYLPDGSKEEFASLSYHTYVTDNDNVVKTKVDLTVKDINILSLEGTYSEYEKGKSFHFDIDKMKITNGMEFLTFTGYYGATPYNGKITFPVGKGYNVAVPEEMNELIKVITQKLKNNFLLNQLKDYLPIEF